MSEGSCLLQLKDSNIDHETEVVLTAQTKEGLQTGAYVRIHPRKVAAPRLTGNPVICLEGKMLRLSYDLRKRRMTARILSGIEAETFGERTKS